MDNLRKAAEMALEALEDSMYPQKKQFDAIIELRQALAQPDWTTDTPVPPFKYLDFAEYKGTGEDVKIKHSLAKPEQFQLVCKKCGADRTKDDCKGERIKCGIMGEAQSAQPEQEPVIDRRLKVKIGRQYGYALNEHWFYLQPADEYAEQALTKHSGISAPPSKPWVSLTDDEVWEAYEKGMYEDMWFARAIEAALRSKNNGN